MHIRTVRQLMDMSNRTILITGATGGLGRHMAETMAELGGNLILVDRPGSNYVPLISVLEQYKCKVKCIDCDLENSEQRTELIKQISMNPFLATDYLEDIKNEELFLRPVNSNK